jgi:hypothetical protein
MKFGSLNTALLALRRCTVVSGAMLILTGMSACEIAGKRTADVGSPETDPCQPKKAAEAAVSSSYNQQVMSLGPALYLPLGASSSNTAVDMTANGPAATFMPASRPPNMVAMPNGDLAANFNGLNQYVEVPSSSALSITHTGCLTVQAWIKPATLQFPHEEGTGYVYILGKGSPREYEYAIRMYSANNTEVPVRPNRISGYVFNLAGGLGSGAYFQDPVEVGQWIMVTLVIDDRRSTGWPDGYVSLYKDGVLRQQVSLSQYDVKPHAGDAPLCIGTRDNDSYFEGAIGKVAVYDEVLSGSTIAATYKAMFTH